MFSWDSLLHVGTRFRRICKFGSRADLPYSSYTYLLCFFQTLGRVDTEGFDAHLHTTVFSSPDVGQSPRCHRSIATLLEPHGEYGRMWKLLSYATHVSQGGYEFCRLRVDGRVCLCRSNGGKILREEDEPPRPTSSILSINFARPSGVSP